LYLTTLATMTSPIVSVSDSDQPITSTAAITWAQRHHDDGLYLHPHWLRYHDVIDSAPEWFIYSLGVYITIVGVAGICGNATVIAVFLR